MRSIAFRVLTLYLAALATGLSLAHLMELPPRLRWPPELWMATTNFGGQYVLFGTLGAAIEVALVVTVSILAINPRDDGRTATRAGAALFALALGLWWALVFPMNQTMATWSPSVVPPDFVAVRDRWEFGHAVIALVKLFALLSLMWGQIGRGRSRGSAPSASDPRSLSLGSRL